MIDKKIKDLRIAVAGVGMVGSAIKGYFEKKGIKPLLSDPGKNLGSLEELNQADVVFVCVPTPYLKDGKGFDLSYNEDVCDKLTGSKIVVLKSTVVPGTTEMFQEKYPQHKFLFNPEFLTEVTADQDMAYPDRQILGVTKESYNVAKDVMLLLPLAPYEAIMPATEAEFVKYYGNNWFAVKVTFANQMYNLTEKLDLDYNRIMEAAAADKRIGPSHLTVVHKGYRGYGGKCLIKDIRAMIQFADKQGVDMKLFKTTEELNNKLMEEQGIEDPEKFSKRD